MDRWIDMIDRWIDGQISGRSIIKFKSLAFFGSPEDARGTRPKALNGWALRALAWL